jgi:predicted TIM-barrel fold metal-dependent hydrolase
MEIEIEDVHIHIGQYENEYYEAEAVFDTVFSRPEIQSFYYSSTTSCKEDVHYFEVAREIEDAAEYRFPENKSCAPLLWYKPEYIAQGLDPIKEIENSRGLYEGIKLHPFADNWDFEHNHHHRTMLHRIFESAGAPYNYGYIFIHTGESGRDDAKRFLPFFTEHDVPVILAHGRPIRQTIRLLQRFNKMFCDTAFMSEEAVRVLAGVGLGDRIFTGSDFPITHYFSSHDAYGENSVSLAYQYNKDIAQMKKYQTIIEETKIALRTKKKDEY